MRACLILLGFLVACGGGDADSGAVEDSGAAEVLGVPCFYRCAAGGDYQCEQVDSEAACQQLGEGLLFDTECDAPMSGMLDDAETCEEALAALRG